MYHRLINICYKGKSHVAAAASSAKLVQLCLTLCDPIDGSPPGSATPGILQARTMEWVAISFSNEWKWKVKVKSLSRVRLFNHMDCSPPGSSIHGIFQARVLEWGAISVLKTRKQQQQKNKSIISIKLIFHSRFCLISCIWPVFYK